MIDIMGTCAPNARPRNALTVKGIEGTTMAGVEPYEQLQYKEINGR
jgi:hypothetical protein